MIDDRSTDDTADISRRTIQDERGAGSTICRPMPWLTSESAGLELLGGRMQRTLCRLTAMMVD